MVIFFVLNFMSISELLDAVFQPQVIILHNFVNFQGDFPPFWRA